MHKLPEYAAALASLAEIEEKIADRGPIKVLPRVDAPNIPALQARREVILRSLRVRRNYKTPKGHDLDAAGSGVNSVTNQPLYDMGAVGIVEEIRAIKKGADRALPESTTIVRVAFPAGEHLYFDPHDLEAVTK